ncbi:methionine synthase, partial [bacterium]|nr:methionine synthase [bacterium]
MPKLKTPPIPGTVSTEGPSDQDYAESAIRRDAPVPTPPFWGSRVVRGLSLRDIFPFMNEVALFRGQWQYQKGDRTDAEYAAFVEDEVRPIFRRLQESAISEHLLVPDAVYGYFPCQADRNDLITWPGWDGSKPIGDPVRFHFPRQPTGKRLCIADFFRPVESGTYDVVALSLVTMGPRATEYA